MTKKVGAKPKFKVQSTTMRISRVVPLDLHDDYKSQVNKFINNLQKQALQKCANEALKNKEDVNTSY